MAPRREHGLQADRFYAACVVAPHLAQASDARGPASSPRSPGGGAYICSVYICSKCAMISAAP